VEPGRLRFDFSHPKPISDEELRQIEDIANAIVLQNDAVTTRLMSVDEATRQGALALFGEKYGEEVRVVAMGRAEANAHEEKPFSIELCGGTHVARTGDIGLIAIVSESAVSAGVRRIEALTGEAARAYLRERDREVREAAEVLKTQPDEILERIQNLVEERRKLGRELAEARKKLALGAGAGHGADDGAVRDVGRVKLLGRTVEDIPAKELRGLVDAGKRQIGSGIVAIVGKGEDGKAGIVVGVTDDLTDDYDAVELVRAGAEALGGKGGGGRRDMAQAGGPDGSRAQAALDAIADRLGERVGA